MIIKLEIPDVLPEGHGGSFKKGIADALLKDVKTPLSHTPNGHEKSREKGREAGDLLFKEVANVVKK